jgi:hypothetical protein
MRFLLPFLLLLVACGTDYRVETRVEEKKVIEKEYIPIAQEFEGTYEFENNSYLEMIVGSDDTVTILKDNQILTSINPGNETLATHPQIYRNKIIPLNKNTLFFSINVNYTESHDIEEDVNGRDIRGQKKTDFLFELNDGVLNLTIFIYSDKINNNTNYIIATRKLKSIHKY